MQRQSAGARLGREREVGEPVEIDVQHRGGGDEHPGRVEGADQWQEPPAGVGEPGDRAARVRGSGVAHREHRARGADRDHDIARPGVQPERGRRVVTRAGPEQARSGPAPPGPVRPARRRSQFARHSARPKHRRHRQFPPRREPQQVQAVLAGPSRTSSRCHWHRCDRCAARSARPLSPASFHVSQSCGRQTASRAAHGIRLMLSQPPQLGHRERGDRHAPDRIRPAAAPSRDRRPKLGDQISGGTGRPGVVPQQRGPTTSPASSRHTIPCCCPATEIAAMSASPPASSTAHPKGLPPVRRIDLRAAGCGACPSRTSSPLPASRITTLHDWVDESTPATELGHRARSRCSIASWFSRTNP